MSSGLLPRHVYLDTGVIIAALFPGTLNSATGADFCRRLSVERCRVYFSAILRLEFSEAVRKLATIQGRVSASTRLQYRLDHWERDGLVRREWMLSGVQDLDVLLERFAQVIELPFDRTVWLRSVEIMAERQIRSHDAVHLAPAYENRLTCFATTDDDLLKIPDLDVRLIRDAAV